MSLSIDAVLLWTQPDRPWFALYSQFLRPKRLEQQDKLAPIQQLLPDELLRIIFAMLPPKALARCCCLCRQWRRFGECPSLWKAQCLTAFATSDNDYNLKVLSTLYGHSWKRMYAERPHLSYNGVYASRNTYFRVGAVTLDCRNPVHLVVYYRYFRFFPNRTVLTRTSPSPISRVWKSMFDMPDVIEPGDSRLAGKWKLKTADVYIACSYPGIANSEMRCKLGLRNSADAGFNDRLDVKEIFTYDRVDGSRVTLEEPDADDEGQEKHESNRGTGTMVFIPWNQVNSHPINQSIKQMDVWIPG